jgi:hypothetical protein
MQSKLKQQKLTLFSVLLLALFTYPLVSIVNKAALISGIPVLFLYIFIVWIIAIIILYLIAERKQKKTDE